MSAPVTSRTLLRQGIAAYFGGTLNESAQAYQNGPLTQYGLGSVRYSYGKEVNQNDFFVGMPPGQGFGAVSIVMMDREREVREAIGGPPVTDGSGNIIQGGWKLQTYSITMDSYFVAQKAYAEVAEENCDALIEAMKQQLRYDRTLGGICMDAGETSYGLRTSVSHPSYDTGDKRMLISFQMQFECQVNIIA